MGIDIIITEKIETKMDEKQKVRKKKKLNLEQNDGLVVVVGQAQETTPEVAPEEPTAENVEAPPSQTVEEEPAQKAEKEDETAEDLENVDSDEKAKSKSGENRRNIQSGKSKTELPGLLWRLQMTR